MFYAFAELTEIFDNMILSLCETKSNEQNGHFSKENVRFGKVFCLFNFAVKIQLGASLFVYHKFKPVF